MRSLIIGASGQLGWALCRAFSPAYQVIEAAHRHPRQGQLTLDLADAASTWKLLEEVRPDLVLVAGAITNVDGCEVDPGACRRVNARGPGVVAEYARSSGAGVVFFSTDHVFDGLKASYTESDPINPLNVYARSKAEGEAAVREMLPDRHLVIRTSWVYGPDQERRNFALRLVDRLSAREQVPLPLDQWGSPTYTEDLASATRFLIEHRHTGTFHATGPELIDRVSLGRRICARFGLDAGRIVPKPTSELGQDAPRPLRVKLECWKLWATGAGEFRGVNVGLDSLRAWCVSQDQ